MHALDNGICVTCRPKEHVLVDGQCVTCSARRSFDPSQPRDEHGRWSLVAALLKVGKSTLQLQHHGDGNVSVHDQHGGSVHLSRREAGGGKFGNLLESAAEAGQVGDKQVMSQAHARDGELHRVAVAGIHKTHVAQAGEPGVTDPMSSDRHTLHLSAGGKGAETSDALFARPGTELTGADLQRLGDTLGSFSASAGKVDTGHGSVTAHVVGRDYTLDTGKRGERPIVLDRAGVSGIQKALTAAEEDFIPSSNPADHVLTSGERFQRVIHTKHGDITVTRAGAGEDFWVESDTTAIRISSDRLGDFVQQLDSMIRHGPDLKHLTKA